MWTAYDCCRCCNHASPMATIAVMAIAWLPLLLEFISGAIFTFICSREDVELPARKIEHEYCKLFAKQTENESFPESNRAKCSTLFWADWMSGKMPELQLIRDAAKNKSPFIGQSQCSRRGPGNRTSRAESDRVRFVFVFLFHM